MSKAVKKGRWKRFRALIFNARGKENGVHCSQFFITVTARNEADAEDKIRRKLEFELMEYDIGKVEEDT